MAKSMKAHRVQEAVVWSEHGASKGVGEQTARITEAQLCCAEESSLNSVGNGPPVTQDSI